MELLIIKVLKRGSFLALGFLLCGRSKSLKGDKGLILVASVLDTAVSVPSTCSNCRPTPPPPGCIPPIWGPVQEQHLRLKKPRQTQNSWIISSHDTLIQHSSGFTDKNSNLFCIIQLFFFL